jgi:hypothetical protein
MKKKNKVTKVKKNNKTVKPNKINKDRRNLIKFLLVGTGGFALGNIFSSKFLSFFEKKEVVNFDLQNFKVSEDSKELIITDRTGEDILIIDKR